MDRYLARAMPPESHDVITLRVRRSVLFAIAGVLAGIVIGFVAGRATEDPTTVAAAPATPVPGAAATTPAAPPTNVKVDVEGRPSRGPKDAKVTMVEFTDYQCPFCKRYFDETYEDLLKTYDGKIRYVVRNFPITSSHPQAAKAAEAAECAHDQDKFWEYHDRLFAQQERLDVESLKRLASDLGLDRGAFDTCLDGGEKTKLVEKDLEEGRRYGVRGTPTFFINGDFVAGAKPLIEFRSLIEPKLR
jgi:protein-disulfide isomerase